MRCVASLLLVLALISSACGSDEETEGSLKPDEVWQQFVIAFNEGDMAALEGLVAPEIDWTWDSDLFAIHRKANGATEALRGFEDLIARGITFETKILGVEDSSVTAETVFNEPGLAEMLGGKMLLQTDLVTIDDGLIQTWTSTANATVAIEG